MKSNQIGLKLFPNYDTLNNVCVCVCVCVEERVMYKAILTDIINNQHEINFS